MILSVYHMTVRQGLSRLIYLESHEMNMAYCKMSTQFVTWVKYRPATARKRNCQLNKIKNNI